jgi:hypothetical protein
MAKKQMNYYSKNADEKTDTSKRQEQSSSSMQSEKSVAVAEKPSARQVKTPVSLTFEQIAERAKILWKERGCPSGQDDKNWYDAEKQLKKELGVS